MRTAACWLSLSTALMPVANAGHASERQPVDIELVGRLRHADRLCCAMAALMLATQAGRPALAHDWYRGLRGPSGIECCDDRDCRPVPYRLNARSGREEIEANGRWWPVEYDKVLSVPTPDGEAHACWRNPRGKPEFRCIILPGMAELEERAARVTASLMPEAAVRTAGPAP